MLGTMLLRSLIVATVMAAASPALAQVPAWLKPSPGALAGWQVTTDLVRIGGGGAEFQLRPVDARGHALTALEVGATLRHPADRRLDQALIFVETAPGLYVATQTAPSGLWDLALELRRGGQVAFRSVNRMVLR